MDAIYETDENFNFDKLLLLKPTQVTGGNYFIKFRMNGNPLYVQSPKCKTKDSIVKTGKNIYIYFYCILFPSDLPKYYVMLSIL